MTASGKDFALDTGGDVVRLLFQIPRDRQRPADPEGYDLCWRHSDGFGQIPPRPSDEKIATFYADADCDTHRVDPAPERAPTGLHWRALRRLACHADRGRDAGRGPWTGLLGGRPATVLEIGCGNGGQLRRVRDLGHTVVGVEPDPRASDIPRTSGSLVVEVPNNGCLGLRVYGRAWNWLDVPRHLNFFAPAKLARIIRGSGFDLVQTEYRGYARQFSKWWLGVQARSASLFGDRPKAGFFDAAAYQLRSALAPAARKYDSVRCIAQRPTAAGDPDSAPPLRSDTAERTPS